MEANGIKSPGLFIIFLVAVRHFDAILRQLSTANHQEMAGIKKQMIINSAKCVYSM